ncbi:methyltransferase domain-containing protein [Kribbella sp. ALI-6-A]|uniref:methyltransferase domain-containing protein n=1 Tax=Kribbella sp. ALI-6-A TaxID=1933817 RepID=UPI001EDBF6D9|nr:methyltransferase domain-containing protein [Kribbella sp. ALI-6-A]
MSGRQAATDLKKVVSELVVNGNIPDPRWQAAFGAVPRHLFVPRFCRNDQHGSSVVDSAAAEQWLSTIYSDIHLVTTEDVRSSSTAPSLMASMLEALELNGDERVVEIGTGTGYNAALLSERLGADRVTSVDIDPDLVAQARMRLGEAGYRPLPAVADGVDGYPAGGPYDAVIATCRLDYVPDAWLRQLRSGGVVVTPTGSRRCRTPEGSNRQRRGRTVPAELGVLHAATASAGAGGDR